MRSLVRHGQMLASRLRGAGGWFVAGVVLSLSVLAPLLSLLGGLFAGGGEHWSTVAENVLSRYVLNTALLAVGVVILASFIGVTAAWIQELYDYPLRRVLDVLLVLPMAVPPYVNAFIYHGMFSYRGIFQRIFRDLLGMAPGTYPVVSMASLPGLIVVLSLVLYPYVFLTVRAVLAQQGMGTIEVARTLSSRSTHLFRRVGLPLLRPALVAGAGLVLMETLNEYGAAVYYGVETLSVGVFRTWFAYNDLQTTKFLATLFLLAIFAVLYGEGKLRGRGSRVAPGVRRDTVRRKPTARGLVGVYALTAGPALLGFAIPVIQLVRWAVFSISSSRWELVFRSTGNTILIASAGAGICVVVGALLAYAPRVTGGAAFRQLTSFATLGHAVPGSVVAIGVMGLFGGRVVLIGTISGLLFAYLVRYLAPAHRPLFEGFTQISGRLDEAGRSLGSGPLRTLTRVDLPVMRRTFATAGTIAFVEIIQELPLTTILRPFNFPTLAVETFRLAGDERLAESSITGLALILLGTIPMILLGTRSNRRFRLARRARQPERAA